MNSTFNNKRSSQDILLLSGIGITCLLILPFTVYRFLDGDLLIGALDSIVLVGLISVFISIWFSVSIKYLNLLITCFYIFAILGVIYFRPSEMIYWAYPAIIATYFLLNSTFAAIINCMFIGTVISISILKDPSYIGFYPTLLLVGIFGFIFSFRSEKLNNKLSQLMSEDELTQLKNRRAFDEKIEELLALKKRSFAPLCLLVIEVDYLKHSIDKYSFKQKDQVLFDFAQKIKSMIRTTDYIYRFDDKKFVIITTNSSIENSGNLANNIRIKSKEISSITKFGVTVSIGVSEIHDKDDASSSFERADLALEESRKTGSDSVYLANHNNYGVVELNLIKDYYKNSQDLNESQQIKQNLNYKHDNEFVSTSI